MLEALWGIKQYEHERKKHTDMILSKKPTSILDIGSGTGALYENLPSKYKKRYTGVDISQTFIDMLKDKFPKVDVRLENAESLSFGSKTFGAVVFYDVLRHQPSYKAMLKEALRVSARYVFIIETLISNQSHSDRIIKYKWGESVIYDNWYSRVKMKEFIRGLYPDCSIKGNTSRMIIVDKLRRK
jgi:ubiquinone/menaquinone biosynthesis C-methylase UbiE